MIIFILVYVETGRRDSVQIEITIGNANYGRNWNIRVLKIPCNVNYKAPAGCLQYFTGVTRNVMSYNFAGRQFLTTQNYVNCIRRERGIIFNYSNVLEKFILYFKIFYKVIARFNGRKTRRLRQQWTLLDLADASQPGFGENNACANAYITIPGANEGTMSRYCGEILSTMDNTNVKTAVRTRAQPFHLGVFANIMSQNGNEGFDLKYTQLNC